ncbi:hypothetical protein [Chondromyces apiculatus]|uniref:SCP2 domain-containing protein n=1 Tax=Chondromyces apiculatus DSM 436 TaxID=1192034 RepID=A0A017SUJ7_9BACT|nr:hypothetical protein [Chondromyces apiculatus]EYF00629.1 Hypothetical protein CAP_0382 [Chondromyces apiculatus DSM 436]
MQPIVDLAPGAEDNLLAVRLGELIRDNLARHPKRRAGLRAFRASVLVVAQDTGVSMTMRFDHGRLTVHDGAIGIPTVTFCGDEAVLLRLPQIAFHRRVALPVLGVRHPHAAAPLREVMVQIARGDLKIYGLLTHLGLVLALLHLVSRPGADR